MFRAYKSHANFRTDSLLCSSTYTVTAITIWLKSAMPAKTSTSLYQTFLCPHLGTSGAVWEPLS